MSEVAFELHARDGGLYWRGDRVSIKGVSWFGLETADFALHGLWCANMNKLLDFAAQHFNAIRLPFSCELALHMDTRRPTNISSSSNPGLEGLTTGQVMDKFVQECARRGLLVLLDMHRLAAAGDIPELWYSKQYPEAAVLTAWRTMVLRYKDCWNVFAADLKNEPHGCTSWGCGNVRTDWRLAAERIGTVILQANPKLLIFVEGVERNACCQPGENCWWGGHVAGAKEAPVRLPVADKLVYSPHVYGPDVFGQPYFNDADFPDNMPDIWTRHFGFMKQHGAAICPGEWGGWAKEGSKDNQWQQAVASWFRTHDITDSFYWCLNPNSGDTGGILQDDWATPNAHKLAIIAKAHPNPTRWPQGDVAPSVPAEAQCKVEALVDTASFFVTAGGALGGEGAAPAQTAELPSPGTTAVARPMQSEALQVAEVNSWLEGSSPCSQLDIKVINTGTAPKYSMKLRVAAAGQLKQFWNATQLHDEDGCWCFDFPAWIAPNGGLAVGADIVVGLIIKDGKPTQFDLE